jgi:hypothetical protein
MRELLGVSLKVPLSEERCVMSAPNFYLDYLDSQDVGGSVGSGLIDPLDGLEFEHSVFDGNTPARPQIRLGDQGFNCGRRDLPLYLDLETVPDEERMHLFDLPPLPEVPAETTSANCPEPAEILKLDLAGLKEQLARLNPDAAYLELLQAEEERTAKKPRSGLKDACKSILAAKNATANAERDRLKQMATCPEMCRIVAVGWARGDENPRSSVVNGPDVETSERQLLEAIWIMIQECAPIVGYNLLGFDLQVIRARSVLLGVEPSRTIDDSPWSKRDIADLMLNRFGRGGIGGRPMKLKQLAKLYGIPVPAGDVDGSQVQRLLAEDPEKLGEYVRSDVHISRELHRKWQGYWCD